MNLRPWRCRPTGPAVGGAAPDFDEAKAFVDHARWLIEYHNKRSDAFGTRAVALLGFSGVTLALLSRGSLPGGVELNVVMFVSLLASVGLLLLTAYFCLRTITVTKSSAPSATDLKTMWSKWASTERRGAAHGDIAETYLKAKTPDVVNAVEDAVTEANERSRWFRNGALAMLAALALLAFLLLLIASQTV